MGSVLKRIAVAAVLLSLLTLTACGDETPQPDTIEVPKWAKVAPEQIAEAKRHGVPVAFENDLGMRFVLIPAGTFLMGSPEDEEGRGEDETQHKVTITKPYYMQITEVTNGQFLRFKPEHHDGFPPPQGDAFPVAFVDHVEALGFASWLSRRSTTYTFRLPTEAEWERACRAGSRTRFFWGDSTLEGHVYANAIDPVTVSRYSRETRLKPLPPGWSRDDGHRQSAPVASFGANKWGLFDMAGNVWERCADWYAPYPDGAVQDPQGPTRTAHRLLRGGSWLCETRLLRSASRMKTSTPGTGIYDGFRLVSPLPERTK